MSHSETSVSVQPEEKQLHGYLVEFENVDSVMSGARKVRDAGFTKWDTYTPFPIHGMDDAMGIRNTILPWIVLGAGLTGLFLATLMQWWMNAVDYQFMISGKPMFSLPANVPIMFEVTVLFSAISCVLGLMTLNGLPQLYHPVFSVERFARATDDRFFIMIDSSDPKFNVDATRDFLNSLGGTVVEPVED